MNDDLIYNELMKLGSLDDLVANVKNESLKNALNSYITIKSNIIYSDMQKMENK